VQREPGSGTAAGRLRIWPISHRGGGLTAAPGRTSGPGLRGRVIRSAPDRPGLRMAGIRLCMGLTTVLASVVSMAHAASTAGV